MTDSAQNGMAGIASVGEIVPVIKTLHSADLITPTGLNVAMLDGYSFEEYESLGAALGTIHNWSRWAIADWLLYGEQAFGELMYQAALATGRSEDTLKRWRWVGERVPTTRRREELSFSIHQEVAALPAKEQRKWLNRAAREQLTQRSLHRMIREEAVLLGVDPPVSRPRSHPTFEVVDGLPEQYVLRGPLCRRLVREAIGTGDAWVKVPRELVNEIASVIGEDPV